MGILLQDKLLFIRVCVCNIKVQNTIFLNEVNEYFREKSNDYENDLSQTVGATTFSIKTLSIKIFSITTYSIAIISITI